MNGSVLVDDNNGDFLNELNPVYDDHGLVLYYQRSSETYKRVRIFMTEMEILYDTRIQIIWKNTI